MPDPTQNETQSERTDQLRLELQKLIMPILATRTDGKVKCIGTGFLIVVNGRRALMVTAAHNIDFVRKVENPHPAHHLSTLFRVEKHRFELHKTRPRAMYYHSGDEAHKALIEASVEMPNADLALCSITFEDDVPDDLQFQTRFGIDTSPVCVNDPVIAIGYSAMKTRSVEQRDNRIEHAFEARWQSPRGRVTAVYPVAGPRGRAQASPCFELDVSLLPGMSGGPVMTWTRGVDGAPYVRGVARSDLGQTSAGTEPTPTALASMLWPLMMMPISLPDEDGTISGETLLDLQREGEIIDRGNASAHVKCIRGENGQVTAAYWEP
jgi:Trypsin-like peptidase domain